MEEFTSVSTGCFAVKPTRRKGEPLLPPSIFKEESCESLEGRFAAYTAIKDVLDTEIDVLIQKLNEDSVRSVTSFIQKCSNTNNLGIPTLTIKTGVNFQEFSPIYDSSAISITDMKLKSAILDSNHASDITNALKNIFMQIVDTDKPEAKVLHKTLSLKELFHQLVDKCQCEGLVIFIPRFDIVPSETMDKLVNICSSNMQNLKTYFILGLATGSELSEEWMMSSTLSQLHIETISLPSPTMLLEDTLGKTLLNASLPFKLSYPTFEVLLSRFSFSSYSLHDVMKTVKVALLNHCLHQPLFRLVQSTGSLLSLNIVEMTDEDKALALQLPSVQKHLERITISNKTLALDLLNGNEESIKALFADCAEKYSILYISFKILHIFLKNLPGNNLVSKPLELYSFFIQGDINKIKEVSIALKCFGMLDPKSFIDRLRESENELCIAVKLPQRLRLLRNVIRSQVKEMESLQKNDKNSPESLHSLNMSLRSSQKAFVSRIENFLSTIGSPETWPMHEVIWYTNNVDLRNMLSGKCRSAIHHGLANPELYLQTSEAIPKPDICYLYEIFHEHGRLIPLHDWIQSFNALLERKKISRETHAMFIRCVSELHFLGYLKPTKRKTDHVAKLTLMGY